MTKSYSSLAAIIICMSMSCKNEPRTTAKEQISKDTLAKLNQPYPAYKALRYVDSFVIANGTEIKKSNALKEHYEGLCTKQLLPLIEKNGLYNDIPFELLATTTHNGIVYGNFIYDDDTHFIKVTCIITEKQLVNLQEKKKYLIKFKVAKFQEGITFDNDFFKLELPTVSSYLTSFSDYNKLK